MGDRISVSFTDGVHESVALFNHCGGKSFLNKALGHIQQLRQKTKGGYGISPLDRLEPQTVMVDFIRHLTKNMDRVAGDLYLWQDYMDGDNSDNGHFTIDVTTGSIRE